MFWIIAAIEGLSTLAVEVIAIRLAIPIVGSSATLTGVTLGVVLLALSAGYWRGGAISAKWDAQKTRMILARNIVVAALLYGAVAFPLEPLLLEKCLDLGLGLGLAIGLTMSVLFLAPVYLASQTVPMLAELTNTEGHAGKASGKVLFFSTLGSVAGGIITPIWLFPTFGVSRSTYLICAVLAAAGFAVALGRFRRAGAAGLGISAAIAVATVFVPLSNAADFSFDSAYQNIQVVEDENDDGRTERILLMGGGRASGVWADTGETSFKAVLAAEQALAESRASEALVLGSAGFNFPRDVIKVPGMRSVDAVDVDPSVKWIAEKQFLQRPLPPQVRFLPLSARYAVRKLRKDGRRYGFTFLDAYCGKGIPDELLTKEFFSDVAAVSGHTAANVIMDRRLKSRFAQSVMATFREGFGGVWVTQTKTGESRLSNILLTSWPTQGSTPWTGEGAVYHDDKNSADRDRVAVMWGQSGS